MTVKRRHIAIPALALITALTLAAGCSTNDPTDKDEPLQTAILAEITQQVTADADNVAGAAGTELINWKTTPTPCMGANGEFADDDRWYLTAGGNLKVAPPDQAAALQRIKASLEEQGWEITDNSTFADGTRGNLDATNPTTRHVATITTTMDLQHVTVSISSPCYMPAPGENPLKG
ncbi:hypothetical protein [Actinoplanes derwentensis]|uniref:LppA-like lipoprotein n=1 Tax=Actinoplanes derwentensis TaxID=113562 RepID=A0A1H2CK00_9ACTN|nr:hypothetical protein [Actinoplanes derwentensis]GID82565.1 hypothetical protein Ade03nite_14890 [Actinoplanes derwentensis]SDT70386.1 hypothetical protein SAMN04489716_5944 [Actinoplanes derwentensis]